MNSTDTSAFSSSEANDSIECFHCEKQTPYKFNFCIECEDQVKCLACGNVLIRGKSRCLNCGTSLVPNDLGSATTNHYLRKVKRTEEIYEEHIELSMSDRAVDSMSPFIASQVLPNSSNGASLERKQNEIPAVPNKGKGWNSNFGEEVKVEESPSLPEKSSVEDEEISSVSDERDSIDEPTKLDIRFFEVHEGSLIASTKDFKGQSWAEQQINFFIVYTNAYFLSFKKPVPNAEHYRIAGDSVGVIDKKNFTRHLKKFLEAYTMSVTNGYKLNDEGQSENKKILSLMEDKASKAGMKYWSRTPAPVQNTVRLSAEDKGKVDNWLLNEVDLGELDLRMLKNASDYVALTLWILTKHLRKVESATSGEAFTYLVGKYDTVTIDAISFRRALGNNKGTLFNFNKSHNSWFLTPEGEERVKSWISGQAKTFKSKQVE